MTRVSEESVDECRRQLREDMKLLGEDNWDPQRMKEDVSSVLACPLIYGSSDVADSAEYVADSAEYGKVVAVLFADSTQVGAFDEGMITQIVAACEEFGRYLQCIAHSQAPELISVKSQATCYSGAGDNSELFNSFSLLTASKAQPPRVPVGYINLDWWT